MQTYLVGGAVRDQLLEYPVYERDWVVVGATAAQLLDAGYQQVGKDFPVFLHPQTRDEYALARTERKSGHGYQGFVVHASKDVTLEEDLQRRDLTINAMALDDDGELTDPFHGQQDLEDRLLRHVSPAFSEDPLRVFRVARFLARYHHMGFVIADETLELMRKIVVSGELKYLSAERVWQETSKAIAENNPAKYFESLRQCGALKVWFPEVDALFGVPQPEKWHPEIDTGVHTMLALEVAAQTSADNAMRYATLCHDLGKGVTLSSQWPSHQGHEKKGVALVRAFSKRLKVPKQYQELAELVCEYHLHCHRARELRAETVLMLFNRLDAYRRPERLRQYLQACAADVRGRTGFEADPHLQADYLQQAFEASCAVSAKDIQQQGLEGAQLGAAIDHERKITIEQVKRDFWQNK